MDSVCSEYILGMKEEFICINEIKQEDDIDLSENTFTERTRSESKIDSQEELVELQHSPFKDWSSLFCICFYCKKALKDFANLKAHQKLSHQIVDEGQTYFECLKCKEPVLGYSSFLNHIRGSHFGVLKLCCDVCNDILPDYEQLSIHRNKHIEIQNNVHPTVHHCSLCEKVHPTEELLKHHIQDSHKTNAMLSYTKDEDRNTMSELLDLDSNYNKKLAGKTENNPSNNKETEMLNQLRKMTELQKITNDKLDQLTTKFDRQAAEIASLRTEVASIKAKVCGEVYKLKEILPKEPINTIEELNRFEQSLKEEKIYRIFVTEILSSGEKAFDKFIRNSWRSILTDNVARQCSWRGTEAKMCVRGLHITLGIRTAFKQKFALDDADFDRTTQKFFQYAQDRLSKGSCKKIKSITHL